MLQIKPELSIKPLCPVCDAKVKVVSYVWHGIHVSVDSVCPNCSGKFIIDLPIGHSFFCPLALDKSTLKIYGPIKTNFRWHIDPFLKSISTPTEGKVSVKIKRLKKVKEVVILNCLDYLYGHCLLKLLNANKLLKEKKALIVIAPKILEWMIPSGVAEKWVVDIPLSKMHNYYPQLNKLLNSELKRFKVIYLDYALFYEEDINIKQFTNTDIHNFTDKIYRISFIWREDRPWFFSDYLTYAAKKIGFLYPLVWWQNIKIQVLFYLLKRRLPKAKLTVAGIGIKTRFPGWIEDIRFTRPNASDEKKLCKIYSESRVVIGVHGSNMLLPSAHAGMVLDLLPDIKIGNMAQDVLYNPMGKNPRILAFSYRYLPISVPIITLARTISSMITSRSDMLSNFIPHNEQLENFDFDNFTTG